MELAQILERNADLRGHSPHNPYVSNKIWMVVLWVRIIGKNQKKAKKLLTEWVVFLHSIFIIIFPWTKMNTPAEPEWWKDTSLIAYDNGDNVFKWAPLEINGEKSMTNQRWVFDLAAFVWKKITRILVNWVQLNIRFWQYILKKSDKLLASVKNRTVELINSNSTLLTHPVWSLES
jgi:hypothetical protein